jgi:hypothetical protein
MVRCEKCGEALLYEAEIASFSKLNREAGARHSLKVVNTGKDLKDSNPELFNG